MVDPEICSQSPKVMQYLESENLVFYGAADIGKSTVVRETDDVQQVEQLADLEDKIPEYIALDDIYCLYQEYQSSSNQALREKFEEVLERDAGVCLVTRPRSLDWLFTHTDFPNLIEIDKFRFLARSFDEEQAAEKATTLVSDLSRDTVKDNIGRLEYNYTFEAEILENYSTYVPYIVLRSSALGEAGGIFPGDLLDLSDGGMLRSLRGFAGRFSESIGFKNITKPSTGDIAATGSEALEFIRDYEQVYEETIQPFLEQNQGEIQATAASIASGVGASAAPIIGPLIVGALLKPDGTARSREATVDFFGELLDDELFPTSRCALEDEMDVPPMTLECLRTVTRPEFHSQLTHIMNADIDHLETVATQTQSEVESLEDDLEQLSDRITVIEGFISNRTQDAVKSEEAMRSELEELEKRHLRVSGQVAVDELELQNVDVEHRYQKILRGSKIQVLRGPHGTGKTTLSYRLCQNFSSDGYTVCIPQLNHESQSFVKAAFEGVQGPVVAFTSYRIGAFSVDDASQISFLLKLVDDEIIDKLLIECRDEVYGQLNDEVKTRTTNERIESGKAELWRFKEVFELPQIGDEGIQAIARWVGEIKGNRDAVQEQLSRIIEIAGHNPEVAKIAARMVCDGQNLSNIQSEDQLIWHDIQNLTAARSDQIETAQRTITKWLATGRGLSENELKRLTDISRDVLAEALDNLSGYWQMTDEGTYQLIPDIYQEIIFREECLEQLDYYIPILVEEGYHSHLTDIALNVTICANLPHKSEYPELEQRCLSGADIVLSTILEMDDTDRLYYLAVNTLATTKLPLSLERIEANELVNGAVEQVDTEAKNAFQRGRKVYTAERPEQLSLDILSSLLANYVLAEKYEGAEELLGTTIETYRCHQNTSPMNSAMLQYRGETAYEHEMQYVMESAGKSFERIAAHHNIDDLVGDMEAVLDSILAHQEGDLQYPYPDSSEASQMLQTTVIFYSQAIAGVAHVENEQANIDPLVSNVHSNLSQTFKNVDIESTMLQNFSEEDRLVRAHALFIKSLMYQHEFDLVDSWPDTIESHVNDAFDPEHQCLFYKYIVEWAATRADMDPRPGWLIWILSHEGILSIATDDELNHVQFENGFELTKKLLAACMGVNRIDNLPRESAKLMDLLEARGEELDDKYSRIYMGYVEDMSAIYEVADR